MAGTRIRKKRQSLFNSHFTITISIALVLFLLGIMGILVFTTDKVTDHVKENIGFSIVLEDNARDVDVRRMQKYLDAMHYVKSTEFINKDRAAAELSEDLGEDFLDFLGDNPLLASIEVHLKAEYANPDSIALIEKEFESYSNIREVIYQKDIVHLVNENVRKITFIILAFSLLLFIVSVALINNTVRLSIYSQRFLINTMQLVGATRSFVRRPFVTRCVVDGFIGAVLAIAMLSALIYSSQAELKAIISFSDIELILMVYCALVLLGMLITQFSAFFAVNKYLRLRSDELYF